MLRHAPLVLAHFNCSIRKSEPAFAPHLHAPFVLAALAKLFVPFAEVSKGAQGFG